MGSDNPVIEKPFINQSPWKWEAPPPLPPVPHHQTPSLGWNNSERKGGLNVVGKPQRWERVGFGSGVRVGSPLRGLVPGRNLSSDGHRAVPGWMQRRGCGATSFFCLSWGRVSAACSRSKPEVSGMERHINPSFLVFTLLSHSGRMDLNFVKI